MEPRFVTIATFRNATEADFFHSLLDAHGFDVVTRGTSSYNATPYFGVFERVRLQVPADQAKAAISFLREQPPPEPLEDTAETSQEVPDEDVPVEQHLCPECGGEMLPPIESRVRWRMLMGFAVGFGLALMQGGTTHWGFACAAGAVVGACVGVYLVTRRRPWFCPGCRSQHHP